MPLSDLNLPPMTPSELPSSEGHSNPLNAPGDANSGMLTLTDDQLSALGLEDCKPGDSYTIKLTKADSGGGDSSFEVDDVSEGGDEDGGEMPGQADEGETEAPDADTDSGIPNESPAPDDKGATPPGEANAGSNGAEEKMIGVKRKKKGARGGLPSTMKLRDY
jgi:hypothetical protein